MAHSNTYAVAIRPTPIQLALSQQVPSIPQEETPTQIIIPSARIDLPIARAYEHNANDWDVSNTKANFAMTSALPNQVSGNTVIYAHNRAGLFSSIRNIRYGDEVYIYTENYVYTYTFTKTETVGMHDVEIMNQTVAPILTLFTCAGNVNQNRYVVLAHFTRIAPRNT